MMGAYVRTCYSSLALGQPSHVQWPTCKLTVMSEARIRRSWVVAVLFKTKIFESSDGDSKSVLLW
jgi:hypothetical protein